MGYTRILAVSSLTFWLLLLEIVTGGAKKVPSQHAFWLYLVCCTKMLWRVWLAVRAVPVDWQTPVVRLNFLWNGMERKSLLRGLYVIENMVARDGIEPPTPAFSGLRSTS